MLHWRVSSVRTQQAKCIFFAVVQKCSISTCAWLWSWSGPSTRYPSDGRALLLLNGGLLLPSVGPPQRPYRDMKNACKVCGVRPRRFFPVLPPTASSELISIDSRGRCLTTLHARQIKIFPSVLRLNKHDGKFARGMQMKIHRSVRKSLRPLSKLLIISGYNRTRWLFRQNE